MASDAPQLQRALVDSLKQRGKLENPQIEAAFLAVPRHLFLTDLSLEDIYSDRALPTKRDSTGAVVSSSSQPSMMVLMLNQLRLKRGERVLEIGGGTGYNAAIMAHIVGSEGHITTVEFDTDLAQRARENLQRVGMTGSSVEVIAGDGSLGYLPNAPYDHIIATVGIWDVPNTWLQQLKPGGLIVAPIWLDALQMSAAFRRQVDDTLFSDDNIPCGFITLRGEAAGPLLQKRVGSSALSLLSGDVDKIDDIALHLLLSDDAGQGYMGLPLTAGDFWQGFMPYLMLNEPAWAVFVFYAIDSEQQAYGMDGQGFALIGKGSACFVPYEGAGNTFCFGGADAFVALQEYVSAWDAAGRPNSERLRLLLTPKDLPHQAASMNGKAYPRHEHILYAWLETV
ncbi:MAG: methyltransferase domain-containing protein [Burkholderiales bacterium]|nr:methyltransferase domain-containing protein [Anaerolineae bacterium]